MMLNHEAHGATYLAPGRTCGPNQLGFVVQPKQVDLHLAVSEHMNMRRQVVVEVGDEPQAVGA